MFPCSVACSFPFDSPSLDTAVKNYLGPYRRLPLTSTTTMRGRRKQDLPPRACRNLSGIVWHRLQDLGQFLADMLKMPQRKSQNPVLFFRVLIAIKLLKQE